MAQPKFDLVLECQRHALAKRLREVIRTEREEIYAKARQRVLEGPTPSDIPRVPKRRTRPIVGVAQHPPAETEAKFWRLAFELARYQLALGLSNADFVRTLPHLRHPTTWIKVVRGNFGKQHPLLRLRWTEVLTTVCELLDREDPNWRSRPPELVTPNLERAEIRALAWQLELRRLAASLAIRPFVAAHKAHIGSWKNFKQRLLTGEVPESKTSEWLEKLRLLAVQS